MTYLFSVSYKSVTFTNSRLLSGDYFYEDDTIYIFDRDNHVYGRHISTFNIKEIDENIERPYIDISSKVYRDDIHNHKEAYLLLENAILNVILSSI